ncbi:MAG: M23 family metallopeptidase [Flavobacteriales bacterium]
MAKNSKYRFFKKLKNKYLLVLLNNETFEERIALKITPLLVLSVMLVIGFLMVISVFFLFSYTPLKEYIPGKTTQETQKDLITMSLKVDSLVVLLERRDLYVENLKIILNGDVPVSEKEIKNSDIIEENIDLEKSEKDSLFRIKIERETNGDYISISSNNTIHFLPPLVGNFTEKYNKEKRHFGVDLVSTEGSIINSIADGVVVTNNWTKETGFVIGVQHSDGFLSFYKHNSKNLKDVGDFVKIGEGISVIGNSGELSSGPHLHFELWKNGESINPENYILF